MDNILGTGTDRRMPVSQPHTQRKGYKERTWMETAVISSLPNSWFRRVCIYDVCLKWEGIQNDFKERLCFCNGKVK